MFHKGGIIKRGEGDEVPAFLNPADGYVIPRHLMKRFSEMTEDKEKEIEQAPTTDQEQEPTEVESTGGAKSGGDDAATTTTGPSAPNEGTAGPAT